MLARRPLSSAFGDEREPELRHSKRPRERDMRARPAVVATRVRRSHQWEKWLQDRDVSFRRFTLRCISC
jgi:hypothetical protein